MTDEQYHRISFADEKLDEPMNSEFGAMVQRTDRGLEIKLLPLALTLAASEGDRDAIKACSKGVSELLRDDLSHNGASRPSLQKQEASLVNWAAGVLQRIAEGEEPNIAFDWKQKKRGRSGPGIHESIRRQVIASLVEVKRESGSVSAAVTAVSEGLGISEDRVWEAYKNYKGVSLGYGQK